MLTKRKTNGSNSCISPQTLLSPKKSKKVTDVIPCNYRVVDGYLLLERFHLIAERYRVVKFIGRGTYSYVYHCFDTTTSMNVAVKVMRNIPKYRDAALQEIVVLEKLLQHENFENSHCLQILSTFNYYDHICMVFHMFDSNLLDFIKSNGYRGMAVSHIRIIAKQLLECLEYIHSLDIIHSDLKLENIMFLNARSTKLLIDAEKMEYINIPKYLDIKLIDFGSSLFEQGPHPSIVSTRHYRAPEVVLAIKYTKLIDIWSLGCVLFELYTGRLLFETHSDADHLRIIEKVIGKIPPNLAIGPLFDSYGKITGYPDFDHKLDDRKNWPLENVINSNDKVFLKFCKDLLEIDSTKRMTATNALNHDFFKV